jgi:N-acetylneuraminic acid mutarotase
MSSRFIYYAFFALCLHFQAIGQPFNWTATTNLPEKRSFHLAFGWDGHIYIVGGVNSSQNVDGHANYAAILPDHSLDAWTLGPSVTSDLYQPGGGIFADSGWIYVAGGVTHGSPLTDVFYAKLNPDGSIGPWQPTSSLPEGTSSPASTLHREYLYVIGGGHHFADYDGSSTVYFAQVQSDGSLSAWNSTTPYPGQLLSSF